MSKVLIYMPYTWPTVSTKVFKSFVELIRHPIENVEIDVLISKTFPLDRNRNEACDLARSNKYNADYIFFVDGDNVLPKNALEVLLSHCTDEYPVVSGVYFGKKPPHWCIQGHYSDWKTHEHQRPTIEKMGFVDKDGNQCLFYRHLKDFTTVQPIDVAGCGCLLVRCDVFDKIEMPYFRYHNAYSLGGDFTINSATEEMEFFCKLHQAGIKTLCVPSVRCGHVREVVVGCAEELDA